MTRNPEIGNTPSDFCQVSEDWAKLVTPNLARMSLMKLLNTAKCHGYSFYRFLVIKEKPSRLGLKYLLKAHEIKTS